MTVCDGVWRCVAVCVTVYVTVCDVVFNGVRRCVAVCGGVGRCGGV